jgi:KaiC/GvpD/RAD55 family RecA-like ATPase
MDDLRRWLAGEEAGLLDWLNEEDEAGPAALAAPGETRPESEELAAARQRAEKSKAELVKLRALVMEELKSPPAQLNEKETAELSEHLKSIFEQADILRGQFDLLAKLNHDSRLETEGALARLPKDQEELVRKQIELRERESLLENRETERTSVNELSQEIGGVSEGELEKRFRMELLDKETEYREKEREHHSKVDYLAEELKSKSLEIQQLKEELNIVRMGAKNGSAVVEGRLRELQLKEKRIALMEEEAARLKIEIRERDDELKKIKEVVGYKQQEMMRREEDLDYREKLLTTERVKFDDVKKDVTGVEEAELKRRLEELKAEVQQKEEELLIKEKYLNAKAEDLRLREQGVIDDEIQQREEERTLEIQVAKAKTGNARFDDLLLGGIPFGSNVLIHGPPFVGKEIMMAQFVAEGLKKGVPAIWVITDKTARDTRTDMDSVLSGYEEYEHRGLVRYVDAYSKSMGEVTDDPYTSYIDEPTDHDMIMEATEKIAKEFKEKHKYYRLAFRSLSTLIAYSDPTTAFRFLSPFCGRRKRDGAVSMYSIEKGVHGEQEIQMLGSIMDGMVDFKLDQLKNFFSVQGVCDVQSRSYIRYTVGKHGLSIGSFSLDHIR